MIDTNVVNIDIEKQEPFLFQQNVAPLTTETLKKFIQRSGRVQKIKANFPDGEDGDLHVRIEAYDASGNPVELVNYIGDILYLSGNDYEYTLDVDIPFDAHTTFYVVGQNVDDTYSYPILVELLLVYTDLGVS